MAHTVQEFATAVRSALTAQPGPAGREKVCTLLKDVLTDDAFIKANFSDATPERQILHEDPELGFCILAHQYQGSKDSSPHDHGPSWAIYGQVAGETAMSDWELISPASAEKPGNPCSASVGTSGIAEERLSPVTAMPRSLPPFTCGPITATEAMPKSIWPPSASVAIGPPPL